MWQHSFIASNGYETRAVGKDYWPIVLHSIFEDSQQDNDNQTSASPAILVKVIIRCNLRGRNICFKSLRLR